VTMVEVLYGRLLWGDDPRVVLHEVRTRLFTSAQQDHDWGSLVAYSSLPEGFDRTLVIFHERQTRRALDVEFDRADKNPAERKEALAAIDLYLGRWRDRLPVGGEFAERERRAECYGLHGASKKRVALLLEPESRPEAEVALREARDWYGLALRETLQGHWQATQYLSLLAVLGEEPDSDFCGGTIAMAKLALDSAVSNGDRAWAHGSLAELAMLGAYHRPKGTHRKPAEIQRAVVNHCRQLVELMGADSFHAYSTRRQFERYLSEWWKREMWEKIAAAAVRALSRK
jgi:hypothetical protein